MGAGAALILPLTLSILPSLFSEAERPRAVALAAAGAFLGLPLGPLVAGWLLTHYDWGSVFLINGPIAVLALLGIWFLVPESKDPHAPPLDWTGAVLSVVGVTAVVYGIIEAPGSGWSDPRVLAGLVGGGAVVAAFVVWEVRARSPLIDLHLFLNPRFTWSTLAFVVAGFAMMGLLFVLTPYLQIVQGTDAQGTGVRLLPMIGSIMLGAVGSDRLTARFGTRSVVAAGLLVTGSGLVVLSRAGIDTGYVLVAVSLVLSGLGLGLAMPPALDAVLASLPPSQTGVGTALSRTLQQIAASLGVAILGSLLNATYRDALAGHLAGLSARAVQAALDSVAGAAGVSAVLPVSAGASLIHSAGQAYVQGMQLVLIVCAALMVGGAALVALLLPGRAESAGGHDAGRPDLAQEVLEPAYDGALRE
jgi:predicted MFS family arabinose efflux permease